MNDLEIETHYIDDEYTNDFRERMEEWLVEIDTARRQVVEIELLLRRLEVRGVLTPCEVETMLDALTAIYIGLARGKKAAQWCRKYPPDFGS